MPHVEAEGLLELRYAEDGVYVRVIDTSKSEIHLHSMLLEYLVQKRVTDVDDDGVRQAVGHRGFEYLIAPAQEEYKIDEKMIVFVPKNPIIANIDFLPPDGGKMLSLDDIMAGLAEKGVVHGIDMELIEALAGNPLKEYHRPLMAAVATKPVRGADAWVEYHFRLKRERVPRVLRDGSVDHKDLSIVDVVREGDALATLHPEEPGIEGADVLGQPIPAMRGHRAVLPAGQNTRKSEDGNTLLAASDGHVEIINGKVTVVPVLNIAGDVATATGNIDFVGDVIVHGNVLSQFSVRATRSVDVRGVVEAAVIKAGGNVIVRQGIKGMGKCEVEAGGDVTAKFIENASVSAGGIIRADVIMHSRVRTYSSVIVAGRRGLLVGGSVIASREVGAYVIGATSGAATVVEVGISPDMRERYNELNDEVTAMQKEANEVKLELERLRAMENSGRINSEYSARLLRAEDKMEKIDAVLPAKVKELEDAKEKFASAFAGRIHARETIHMNVTITIGAISQVIQKRFGSCTLYRAGNLISEAGYSFTGKS